MSEDRLLQAAVLAELNYDPRIVAGHIGVIADAGIVTLIGHVDTLAQKWAAEAAATRIKGVKALVERIEVRLPAETMRSDEEIAAAAIERLAWNVSIPGDAIRVRVENGWVTLSGEVDSFFRKTIAADDMRQLRGVVGLSNDITIRPSVDVGNVTGAISQALQRAWFFDPNIVVNTSNVGGMVRLSGTVHSQHDRELAVSTAWSAPGVTGVENDIVIV